jgi:adenylylsulfate kinase-like enzyme
MYEGYALYAMDTLCRVVDHEGRLEGVKPVPDQLSGCLLLTGMPGSGKTTVTKLVAAKLDRAARICGDDLHQMLVSGRVRFDSGQREEAARQGELRAHNLCTLVDNFAAAGFAVVVDEVVPDREDLDYYVEQIAARPVFLVVLAPPHAVCVRRKCRSSDCRPSRLRLRGVRRAAAP